MPELSPADDHRAVKRRKALRLARHRLGQAPALDHAGMDRRRRSRGHASCSVWRVIVRSDSSSGETRLSVASWRVNSVSCLTLIFLRAEPQRPTAAAVPLAGGPIPARPARRSSRRRSSAARASSIDSAAIWPRFSRPAVSIARIIEISHRSVSTTSGATTSAMSRRDTRTASSGVVSPSRTSWRAAEPRLGALRKAWRAMIASSPPSLIRRRIVSSIRIASNTPIRPLKPVPLAMLAADRLIDDRPRIEAEQRRDRALGLDRLAAMLAELAARAAARSPRAASRRAGTARPSCRACA